MRLATKILLAFGLLLLITLGSVVFFTYRTAGREVRGVLSRFEMLPNNMLARELAAYYSANQSWRGAESVLLFPRPIPGGHNARLLIVDADGTVVVDTDGRLVGEMYGSDLGTIAVPIEAGEKTVGQLVAFEDQPGQLEEPLLRGVNRILILTAATTGVVGLAIAILLSRNLTSPLRSLSAAMQQFARGERNIRLSPSGEDEVGDLTRSFQGMMTDLERQESLRKEMTADIAHELRTPLSVIRANLDALADGVFPLTKENLAPIRESTDLLDRLIEDLRTLELADAGRLALEKTELDVPRLLRRIAARFTPHAELRSQKLEFLPTGDLPPLSADLQRLEQILGNLIDNALRHTPDGGTVRLGAKSAGDAVCITVDDSGPGIPADSLDRIFERFYRLDSGRSRSEGGSGLGLAIARKLADAHGGSLTAENLPAGGARFMLKLPVK